MTAFDDGVSSMLSRNASDAENAPWDIEIVSKRALPPLRLDELYKYKNLVGILVYRDFVIYCKQTILGPLWWLLQPLITCGVFVIIFAKIMGGRTAPVPAVLFFLSGLILWFFFSNTLSSVARTFTANEALFTKIYFPRLAMPTAQVFVNLIKFGLQFIFFIFVYGICVLSGAVVRPNLAVLFLPLVIVYLSLLSAGLGLLFNSLTYKYRDLALTLPFILQMGMFLSSIIHPVSRIPDKLLFITYINPVIPAVEFFRYGLFGVGTVSVSQLVVAVLSGAAIFTLGLVSFAYTNQVFVDNV